MPLEQVFITSLQRIVSIVEELGFEYHLTGGVVSMIYGEPRYTQDIRSMYKNSEAFNRVKVENTAKTLGVSELLKEVLAEKI